MAKTPMKKDWMCNECGTMLTVKAAMKAVCGPKGCPKCGGADIDLAPAYKAAFKAKVDATPGMAEAIEKVAPGYMGKF